ncbi:MAG: ornithine carbamoyltransferase [Chloroflexota bacterium]
MKHILSIADLSPDEVWRLIAEAGKHNREEVLKGRVLALLFEKPSLRTRVSFEVAMHQLGGWSLYLSPQEVGLGQREAIPDVARVLGRFVHGLVLRTFSQESLRFLAQHATIPVINGLSDEEHPCQALADLLTIYQKRGKLAGLTLAFIGDGNNVAHSLLLGCALMGLNFRMACPQGYEPQPLIVQRARALAAQSNCEVSFFLRPEEAVKGADVVYTDVWTSMGQEAEAEVRRHKFAHYQVNKELLSSATEAALFMHPLPAHHGEEIALGLLDHPQSVVFDQAENRLHVQRALLAELLAP